MAGSQKCTLSVEDMAGQPDKHPERLRHGPNQQAGTRWSRHQDADMALAPSATLWYTKD